MPHRWYDVAQAPLPGGLLRPVAHCVQLPAAAFEYVFTGHIIEHFEAPDVLLLPAAHCWHVVTDFAFVTAENVPVLQSVQADALAAE